MNAERFVDSTKEVKISHPKKGMNYIMYPRKAIWCLLCILYKHSDNIRRTKDVSSEYKTVKVWRCGTDVED